MLNNMMLSHALYIEHMNPSALLEGIRQAINEDEKPPSCKRFERFLALSMFFVDFPAFYATLSVFDFSKKYSVNHGESVFLRFFCVLFGKRSLRDIWGFQAFFYNNA